MASRRTCSYELQVIGEMRLCRRYRKGMRISAFAPISLFKSTSSIRFTSIGILWVVLEVDRLVSGKVALPMAAT